MYLVYEKHAVEGSGFRPAAEVGLEGLELVYGFIYSRVGNPADAEDLTQQVALKALPRLREGASDASIRAYLFATARSVLSAFWTKRYRLPEAELVDDVIDTGPQETIEAPPEMVAWLERTLSALPSHYRRVLELRFLESRSLREAAAEMGKSVGAIKLMQMRALRSAAQVMAQPAASARPVRAPRPLLPSAVVRGSASAPRLGGPAY